MSNATCICGHRTSQHVYSFNSEEWDGCQLCFECPSYSAFHEKAPTSETYNSFRTICVQDDDASNGSKYIAECYFTSEGKWEVEETIFQVI